MAAHLPRIVEAFGATLAQAVFAGMMIGPAQVGARIMEAPLAFGLLIEPMGRLVVVVSAGLSLAALLSLMALHRKKTAEAIPRAAE